MFDHTIIPREGHFLGEKNLPGETSEPVLDKDFWSNLLNELENLPEEQKVEALIKASDRAIIIPTFQEQDAPNSQTQELKAALTLPLENIFDKMAEDPERYLRRLPDSTRGRLLDIKYQFNLPNPPDYAFSIYGIFDADTQQQLVNQIGEFVQIVAEETEKGHSPLLKYLLPEKDLNDLAEDNDNASELLTILVDYCTKILGIKPRPIVRYKPERSNATTTETVPSIITFGQYNLSKGPFRLLGTVAHEVLHAHLINHRFRIESNQTIPPDDIRKSKEKKLELLPEHQKYAVNAVSILPPTEFKRKSVDSMFYICGERWGFVAGLAAVVWAAKSLVLNPKQEGIFCKVDPTKSGGDLRICVGEMLAEEIGLTPHEMVTCLYNIPGIDLPVEISSKSASDVEKAKKALHHWKKIYSDPVNASNSLYASMLASMPSILEKAHDPKDPMKKQYGLLCRQLIPNKENLETNAKLIRGIKYEHPEELQETIQDLALSYPDDLSRMILAEKIWGKIKDDPARSPIIDEPFIKKTFADADRISPFIKEDVPILIEINIGASIEEIATHFDLTNKRVSIGPNDVMSAIWRLENLPIYPFSAEDIHKELLKSVPYIERIMDANKHRDYNNAFLLNLIIEAGVKKSLDPQAPGIKEELKRYFEKRYKFKFATSPQTFEQTKEMLAKIARDHPNNRSRDLLKEVAAYAMNESLDSNVGKRIKNAVDFSERITSLRSRPEPYTPEDAPPKKKSRRT